MVGAYGMSAAASANIQILQNANAEFGVAQRRVATGKWVFSASDDTTRYKMSEAMLGRARQIDSINNNISLGLKTLEATNTTLKSMLSLVETAQGLVRKAQSESIPRLRSTNSTVPADASTMFTGYTPSPVTYVSITTDEGKNFRYDFARAGVTYGEVVSALNAANIGVTAEFVPTGTVGQTKVRFTATNGKGFRFEGTSDQLVMRNFMGLIGPLQQSLNANLTVDSHFGAAGIATAVETGFTVAFGGQVAGTKTNPSAFTPSGSSLIFKDGNNQVRTYSASSSATNVQAMAAEFNAQFRTSGVVAEILNGIAGTGVTVLRFRNTNNGNMELVHGTGDFASGSANLGLTIPQTGQPSALYPNPEQMRYLGWQYDTIRGQLDALVQNNPVQSGRNLLMGQNMSVVMDEFAGTPVLVTGVPINAAGTLTLALAGASWDDMNLQTAATQLNAASTILSDYQAKFSTFSSYMKGRYDANAAYRADMKVNADELVGADMAEESANMSALQTRQQFAVQAFSLGTQTTQGLLRLMG